MHSQLHLIVASLNVWLAAAAVNFNRQELQGLLSPRATISEGDSLPRWSEYGAPSPMAVVNVATEDDVKQSVYFANKFNIPFLAQSGGNGWATTVGKLDSNGIIINLAALNNVTFNSERKEVTIQGGALISDVVKAGAASKALVPTGLCNCVGALGAILGAGIGNLMGEYGLGIDNILELRIVNAVSSFLEVNATSDPDLWYAMRGAGPNFGIVTSARLKAYPLSATNESLLNAWVGVLTFPRYKLEALILALGNLSANYEVGFQLLPGDPKLGFQLGIVANTTAPSPTSNTNPPQIIVNVFYHGTPEQGRAAFGGVYAVGPVAEQTGTTTYTHWNDANEAACAKGGRKPNFAAGLVHLDPVTWRMAYGQLEELLQEPGAENSSITLLAPPNAKFAGTQLKNGSILYDSSYPWRSGPNGKGGQRYFASITPVYTDPSFDSTAQRYGFRTRDLWRATSGLPNMQAFVGNQTYINNAYGDETLEEVYGLSLGRLQDIKRTVDPLNRFRFWFPLS